MLALVAFIYAATPTHDARAERDLAEASRLVKSLREEQAIGLLTKTIDRGIDSPALKAQVYVLLGVARFNLRDEEGARLSFRRAFAADPTVALPKSAPPKTRALFEDERARSPEPAQSPPEPPPAPKPAAEPQLSLPVAPPAVEVVRPAERAVAHPGSDGSGRRWAGLATGLLGVAGVATGGVMVASASSRRDAAQADPVASSASRTFEQAQAQQRVGQYVAGGGAAVLAVGLALVLWPASSSSPRASLSAGPGGVGVYGRF